MLVPCSELVLWVDARLLVLGAPAVLPGSGNGDDLCSVGVTARIVDLSTLPSDLIELVLLCAVLGRHLDTGLWSLLTHVWYSLLALE